MLAASSGVRTSTHEEQTVRSQYQSGNISNSEFVRLIQDFSEEGGYFWSDNFISNETSYLHIVDKLKELGASGGAYIGVGPEQNFTYIAKIHPRIAFIVDIRRQAMIQHLLFKSLFDMAPNRSRFLSLLLSKPLAGKEAPGQTASIDDLVAYFTKTATDERAFTSNLAEVRRIIIEEIKFPLTKEDQTGLEYIYKSFREEGLEISFRLDGGWAFGYFPSLKQLLREGNLNGKQGNFLASSEDYDFVRTLQERNRIIPIVGDFAGKKALAAIGAYLRKTGDTVSVFYLSNVEQYLFEGGSFSGFVDNVKTLPTSDKSLFIRSVFDRNRPHPVQIWGHRVTTLLQSIPVFLKDCEEKRNTSYWDLVTTHYVAGERSKL